jgi:hypothetical protein
VKAHELRLRIGIRSVPVVAGVIGRRRYLYDLWGDTVSAGSSLRAFRTHSFRASSNGRTTKRLTNHVNQAPKGEPGGGTASRGMRVGPSSTKRPFMLEG